MTGENGTPATPEWRLVAEDRACEALAAIGERAAQRRIAVRDVFNDPENIERGTN